jgi:hypothetical protein
MPCTSFVRTRAARIAASLALAASALLLQGNIGRTTNLEDRLLAAHNRERAQLAIPPLRWDDELETSAAEWADYLTELGDLEHYPDDPSDPDPQGENLWLGTRDYFSPEQMVGMWIDEKKHFKPGVFPANSNTGRLDDVGHYTQLMWRTTDRVGCAVAENQEYDFLVCRYSEGGNVIGERPF